MEIFSHRRPWKYFLIDAYGNSFASEEISHLESRFTIKALLYKWGKHTFQRKIFSQPTFEKNEWMNEWMLRCMDLPICKRLILHFITLYHLQWWDAILYNMHIHIETHIHINFAYICEGWYVWAYVFLYLSGMELSHDWWHEPRC